MTGTVVMTERSIVQKKKVLMVVRSGGLVLSNSARASEVTYQTVVRVRYSELVTFNRTGWNSFFCHNDRSPLLSAKTK